MSTNDTSQAVTDPWAKIKSQTEQITNPAPGIKRFAFFYEDIWNLIAGHGDWAAALGQVVQRTLGFLISIA